MSRSFVRGRQRIVTGASLLAFLATVGWDSCRSRKALAQGEADTPAAAVEASVGTFQPASPLDVPAVSHVFLFRNRSSGPTTIVRLVGSCPCTSGAIVGIIGANGKERRIHPESAGLPVTLGAGEAAQIRVTIDLKEPAPALVRKALSVIGIDVAAATPHTIASLALQGTILPAIEVDSPVLDLGSVMPSGRPVPSPEDERRWTVTVSYDPRVGDSLPPLASSNLYIRVTALPETNELSAAQTGPAMQTTPANLPDRLTCHRRFAVSIAPDAPLGLIDGMLTFAVPGKATDPTRSAVLRSVSVLVTGRIVGDLSAQPPLLALGTVPASVAGASAPAAVRQISLRATNSAALSGLAATTPSRWLRVVVLPTSASSLSSPLATLAVSLLPGAPPGLLQTNIEVIFGPNRRRLLIPVTAYVSAGGAPSSAAG